jgi:hypothetical protein
MGTGVVVVVSDLALSVSWPSLKRLNDAGNLDVCGLHTPTAASALTNNSWNKRIPRMKKSVLQVCKV